jgi:hypothetical protein
MMDVAAVLQAMPSHDTFCSVEKLSSLASACEGPGVVGRSVNGLPIHHLQFGSGRVRALWVGFPHPNEPIGGLTVFSLLKLLRERHPALMHADVEWHVVPCIDPDGALLNEGWSQSPISLRNYMRHFHRQDLRDQVEASFPIRHGRLRFDQPTHEASILQRILESVRPGFYYPLHNAFAGGAYFCMSHDIGAAYQCELRALLEQQCVPLRADTPFRENFTTRKFYDRLAMTSPAPETLVHFGACSWEYLADIEPRAFTLATELPHLRHPLDGSTRDTAQSQRQLALRIDADSKFIATLILEEWEKVEADLCTSSAFYKKILHSVISARDMLPEGLPSWPYRTRDLLFNASHAGKMTEGQRLNMWLSGFQVVCNGHEFVRLLQASEPTLRVRQSLERLEPVFDQMLDEIAVSLGAESFQAIDCNALAKAQLGSGLIVLNAILNGV